jgi:CelD/BcsL family acetyltransferase involved in cellulose biosynthesis
MHKASDTADELGLQVAPLTSQGDSSRWTSKAIRGNGTRFKNSAQHLAKVDGIDVTRVESLREARVFIPEWASLAETAGARNPFVHPDWLVPWAEHFLRPSEQVWLLMARRRGQLVGVAPFYRHSWGRGLTHSMQLLGTGRHSTLIELPQLLLDGERPRAVARALVAWLCTKTSAWDWAMLPLEDQLWLEPDWLPKDATVTVVNNTVRPSVVLPISKDKQPVVKRNLRESLRRARNRLERAYPCGWSVSCSTERAELLSALPDLVKLHADRSRLAGKKRHPNKLRCEADLSFLSSAVNAAAEHDGVALYRLLIHGNPMAALLALRTRDCTYLSVSGMSQEAWDFSPTTLLQGRAIDDAIALGHRWVNLSTGPDTPKLRWSEKLEVSPEFALIPNKPFSRMAFGAYWQVAAAVTVARERNRHRLLPASAEQAAVGSSRGRLLC